MEKRERSLQKGYIKEHKCPKIIRARFGVTKNVEKELRTSGPLSFVNQEEAKSDRDVTARRADFLSAVEVSRLRCPEPDIRLAKKPRMGRTQEFPHCKGCKPWRDAPGKLRQEWFQHDSREFFPRPRRHSTK
jgi:hypothetical protein